MTARTAYGLDTPRGTHWAESAACGTPLVDPEWWWSETAGPLTQDGRRALHICRTHCPARVACHRAALDNPPKHPCIQGGRRYVAVTDYRTVEIRAVQTSARGCPYCAGEALC